MSELVIYYVHGKLKRFHNFGQWIEYRQGKRRKSVDD